MKINFNKHDGTAMHAKLETICKRVHKLILGKEIAVSHRLGEMNDLRLLEKLAVWRRNNCFDRIEVQDESQHRSQGYVCSEDDTRNCQIDVYFDPRRPPTPQEFTENMRVAVNVLKQESRKSCCHSRPPPQCDVPLRRPSTRSVRSPPQQPCSVSRMVTVRETVESAKEKIPLDVRVCMEERAEGKIEPERRAFELAEALNHSDSSVS